MKTKSVKLDVTVVVHKLKKMDNGFLNHFGRRVALYSVVHEKLLQEKQNNEILRGYAHDFAHILGIILWFFWYFCMWYAIILHMPFILLSVSIFFNIACRGLFQEIVPYNLTNTMTMFWETVDMAVHEQIKSGTSGFITSYYHFLLLLFGPK